LDRQDVFVPPRKLSESVVGNDISTNLSLAEMLKPHRRHGGHPKQASCLGAAVAGHNVTPRIDQNRVVEAEFPDAVGDLSDLLLRMGSRVAVVGFEACQRDMLDNNV